MMGTKKKKVTIQVRIDLELYEALLDIASKKGKSPEQILEKKLKKLEEDPEIKHYMLARIMRQVTRNDVVIAKVTKEDREAIQKGELKYSWEK